MLHAGYYVQGHYDGASEIFKEVLERTTRGDGTPLHDARYLDDLASVLEKQVKEGVTSEGSQQVDRW